MMKILKTLVSFLAYLSLRVDNTVKTGETPEHLVACQTVKDIPNKRYLLASPDHWD